MIAIDQYNQIEWIEGKFPRKELLEKLNAKHAQKMYVDKEDGTSKHVGYIIGGRWFTLYSRFEKDT